MSSWPIVALEDVFAVARGGSPRPIDSFITDDPNGVNWIMIGDASEGSKYISSTKKRIIKEGVKKSRMVSAGDFLLTNSMSFGKPYILKTSGCIHDGWLVLSPRHDQIYSDFFYYLLGSELVYSDFKKLAAGAVVKNLNSELVRGVQIPLPPLDEQKRIAAILDAADALRAKRRQSIAQLDALIQSTFLDLFGDPVTNPMGWEKIALKNAAPAQPARLPALSHGDTWLLNLDQIESHSGKILSKVMAELSTAGSSTHAFDTGNVLYSKLRPYLNKVVCPDSFGIATTELVPLRPNPKQLDRQYLTNYLRSKSFVSWISSQVAGAKMPRVSMKVFWDHEISLPPIPLQQKFAAIVESIERQKTTQRAHLAELDALFASLQHRAFRGEL
jgi:type I restriction enzyme S subunit